MQRVDTPVIPADDSVVLSPIEVYTDGAINNVSMDYPLGGWAFYMPGVEKASAGTCKNCTSNQMEIYAAVQALFCVYRKHSRMYEVCKYCSSLFDFGFDNPPKCC